MENGIYKVSFKTKLGTGTGVIILENGRARGGDSEVYYDGTYVENGKDFTANILSKLHTRLPVGGGSLFGVDVAHIKLTGTSTPTSAATSGTAAEAPGVAFQATLTKLSD